MATRDITTPTPGGSLFFPFVSAILGKVGDMLRAWQNRRQVARLLEWDQTMLRDIGLTRGDVYSAMASPLGDDPSDRLDRFARERRSAERARAAEYFGRQRRRA
jgi:uncharacterized protein YjiS (DUF1127 family)